MMIQPSIFSSVKLVLAEIRVGSVGRVHPF